MSTVPPTDPIPGARTVTVRTGWVRSAVAGAPGQVRVLVVDQLRPAVRDARVRWVPVLVEAGGRAGTTVQTRLLPTVRATGQRFGPVATNAALRAGVTVRAATAGAVDLGAPVTREAARRGLNAWAALLGGQPVPLAAASPTHRRARTVGWVLAVAALTGVTYGAWHTLRHAENPWQDNPDLTRGPAPDLPDAPGPVADPAGPAVVDVEPVAPDPTGSVSPVVSVTVDPVTDATPDPTAAITPAEPILGHIIPTDS